MQYTTLGCTRLKVSVAGLGCGGSSRLGLTAGHSAAHGVGIIRQAVGLGVNVIGTPQSYGTEPVVGAALRSIARESVIVATKPAALSQARPVAVVFRLEDQSLTCSGLRV